MIDAPAYVWQRAHTVLFNTPVPCPSFDHTLTTQCPRACYHGGQWTVAQEDAALAVATLRAFFPVVQDDRPHAPLAPPFVDGEAADVFGQLDLVTRLTAAAPAFHAIHNEQHPARSQLAAVAAVAPDIPRALGFVDVAAGQWRTFQTARRFWHHLLTHLGDAARGDIKQDGTAHESLSAEHLEQLWLQLRDEWCGSVPERSGQRWYPPRSTLPIWAAALIACCDGPSFMLDSTTSTLTRTLSPWPLRRSDALHRLDFKEAAHWPISVCILPAKQSRDGQDALLHLSTVGGVSKHRALWAAILDGKREQLPLRVGRTSFSARRVEGRNQYITTWNDEPLHTSGLSHLVLTHHSAFEPEFGQPFLHLAGNDLSGAPDYALFAQQLSRCLSVPFDLAWGKQLWSYGIAPLEEELPLITPLPSSGCQGYWVLADEARWTRLIVAVQQDVSPATLQDANLTITEIGATAALAEVVEQAGEGGDEARDDVE